MQVGSLLGNFKLRRCGWIKFVGIDFENPARLGEFGAIELAKASEFL